jgi:predicted Rossmann fold nucleotide-binding protein DprA/Smf involved in DNA uptake
MIRYFQTYQIQIDSPDCPSSLIKHLADKAPASITAMGNIDILQNKTLSIFSSQKCPGAIILKTYELMRKLRESGVTVISGFHSPMECECLNILLKGKQAIIFCPARSIEKMRLKAEYKKPFDEGRLLLLSPFNAKEKRISSERALFRNYFVAAIADSIFVSYAAQNSKTEQFCKALLAWNKPLYTLQSNANANLITLGLKNIYDLKT